MYIREANKALDQANAEPIGIGFYWLAVKAIVYALLAIAVAIESLPEKE